MIGDFVKGVLWGTVSAGIGLGVISEMTLPRGGAPLTAEAPSTEPSPAPEAQPESTASAPGLDTKTGATDAPAPPPAEPEPVKEETAQAPAQAEAPPAAPVTEAVQTPAPVVDTGSATAPAAGGASPDLPSATGIPAAGTTDALPQTEAAPAPVQAKLPETGGSVETEEPLLTPVAPEEKTAPEGVDPVAPEPVAPEAIMPEPVAPEGAAPEVAAIAPENPAPEPATGSTLEPAPGLDKETDGVTTGRLPAIGQAETPQAAPEPEVAVAPEDLPPLERYKAAFDNPAAKPLFAVLLVDPGTEPLDRAQLAALPFAVTFVIDPLAANAAEAAAIYVAGGKEVIMMATGLPKGAKAADVEQSLATTSASVPQAVAMIDLASGGFQNDRALSAAVVAILKAQGRGLITYDQGLNAADQVAQREAVPAATVFRSLDDDGEDAPLIRRYLDRAAFKAAQEGRVIVLGTARPETIGALLEWTVEGRASSVALAPATALLTLR